MPNITTRIFPQAIFDSLVQQGCSPTLARIFAARGIEQPSQLETELSKLLPFEQLKNIAEMAIILADAIAEQKRLLIIADYDSDGATACAVAIRALRKFGACVNYLVPNRFEYGYGLTPEIVQLAATNNPEYPPDIIITVDNGIGSIEGVEEAIRLGIQVLITDHHLPGDHLPNATVIVNPNQPNCPFPSKNLAGVGVIFYVMLALRAELRKRNVFDNLPKEPNLASLLDLVALGTVADVVKLDWNNRALVKQGLYRIRKDKACVGIHALLKVAKRDSHRISTNELGFVIGPRLNAAGRLDDMTLGIECLITDDEHRAFAIASQLDNLNRQRRDIEANMQDSALDKLSFDSNLQPSSKTAYSICLYDPNWHQGVIGLIAARIKEKLHRPSIIFAPGNENEIKGSGRSIPGINLRDALDLVSKRTPGLIKKFGGHAAAAGLTIMEQDFQRFQAAFEQIAQQLLTPADLTQLIETDGDLNETELNLSLAQSFTEVVWGHGFPEPSFNAHFYVENQRIVGEKHLKLKLRKLNSNTSYDAILFFHAEPLPDYIQAVYRLQANEFNGNTALQLLIEHWSDNNNELKND